MRTVGAVLFEGFEMLDLYGPLEMFAMHRDAFAIRAVAQARGPVLASGGSASVAQDRFGDKRYDILLVPGGAGTRAEAENKVMLDWLREASRSAELVTSVCTGSALLAAAGLLDGRKATTNKRAFDWAAGFGPRVHWQRKARWVEDGKFLTSSGVSAGIDMSLAVIERLLGPQAAEDAAMWAEYERNADPDNDPFEVT